MVPSFWQATPRGSGAFRNALALFPLQQPSACVSNYGLVTVRGRIELAAARHLAQGGYAAHAVSRAYFAAFHAAEVSLLLLGETRSKHAGVIAAFMQLLVKEGRVEEDVGRVLRSLFDRRNQADYVTPDVPKREAEAAISDAAQFLAAVERWIRARDVM